MPGDLPGTLARRTGAGMDGYVSTGAGWFTLSLVNAGLAQGKGRSGWNWFLLSLVLGPVATFLIVAWPALEADRDRLLR
ncbi:hypothetical protein ABH920_004795 [Catenulispora sp. EB89]|uniref:hypothetical protein n=1 Tax=Catenulispora sp. EB89 TaxID=3156257 RepID=UPI003511D4B9